MQSTRTCSIDGCKATCQARGLCSKHYYRIRANGSPHRETDLPLDERFELCVDKHGPVPQHRTDLGNCWEWTRGVSGDGYGVLKKSGKIIKMHRWGVCTFRLPYFPWQTSRSHVLEPAMRQPNTSAGSFTKREPRELG